MKKYFWNILVSLDQLFNVLTAPLLNWLLDPAIGEFGNPDETLSSVFGKNRAYCETCRLICKWLGWLDTNHCDKSIEIDE